MDIEAHIIRPNSWNGSLKRASKVNFPEKEMKQVDLGGLKAYVIKLRNIVNEFTNIIALKLSWHSICRESVWLG